MTTNEAAKQHDLRRAILSGRLEGLGEGEVLEALLTFVLARGDAGSVAEELLARFRSLSGVLMASPRELRQVRGVGDAAAALVKLVGWVRASGMPPEETRSCQAGAFRAVNGPVESPHTPIPSSSQELGNGEARSTPPQGGASPVEARSESPHADSTMRQVFLSGFSTPAEPQARSARPRPPRPQTGSREEVRTIQDLLWKEALMTLEWVENFSELDAFRDFIRSNLPQNSLSTRTRYAQTLSRWFYPDGLPGLLGRVWMAYREQGLAEEMLRFLYLEAERIPAAAVADALFPIQENAAVPDSYLANFVRDRFGAEVPEKTMERLKSNLRKLGFLGTAAQQRSVLRPLMPSPTGFLVLLHYRFARRQACAVEFKAVASDPFWKYLGFKSEDRLRAILRESLDRGLIAKYVLADRIESVSLRYSFEEFVSGRMSA